MIGPPFERDLAGPPAQRAVSDLLGFAVVFGIVVLSITLLYTVGTGTLDTLQHDQAVDNTERAFDIVATNVEDVSRNGAPGRATELQLASGELNLDGSVTMSITNISDVPGTDVSVISPSAPITYTRRASGLHYAGGAVVRTQRTQAVMVDNPQFRFDDDRTVLSIIETNSRSDTTSLGGTGSVLVETRSGGSTLERIVTQSGTTYELTVVSPRFRAWTRYFDAQPIGTTTLDPPNQTVTYSFTTDALYVRRTTVNVQLKS